MSLKKLTSRALSSNENDNPYILKEDKKYSRYLDNIIKDYSVKQTNLNKEIFEIEENSPKEIQTGTVTKIGQRNVSNWNNSSSIKSSQIEEPIIAPQRVSPKRHSITRAKGEALFNTIKSRQQQPLEEEFDEILSSIPSSSLFFTPEKCKSIYAYTPKSKGMKSFVSLFDVDSHLTSYSNVNTNDNLSMSHDTSRRESLDSIISDVTTTLPKINEPNEKLPKSLFIQTADSIIPNSRSTTLSTTSTLSTISTTKRTTFSSQNSQEASPSSKTTSSSSIASRRMRDRKQATKIQRKPSSSPSSSTTRSSTSYQLKRQSSNHEEYCTNLPSLPTEKATKYFGEKSKLKFYQTYREINHIKDNLLGGAQEIEHFVTLQEKDYDKEIDEIASSSQGWEMLNTDYNNEDGSSTLLSIDDNYHDDLSTIENSPDSQTIKTFDLYSFLSPPKSSRSYYNSNGNGNDNDNESVSGNSLISLTSKRSFTPSSPRAKYIAGCIKNNVPPRSSLLLRDNFTSCLMLEHQGIGDKMGKLLSAGLEDMPFLTSINIADNNLTDTSLKLIIHTISQKKSIIELNISRNKVGSETALELGNYLRSPKCTLKKLSMRAANVDDHECHQFVEALGHNRCLEELDLSENLLGKDENLNAVKPDTVTAGESFSILLHDCRCPIKTLKLSWNMIRMEGAIQFCGSLQYQKHLRYLDISYNSLGREGGVVLGNALLDNQVLEELLISSNNIDGVACFAICIGIREGKSVKFLNIDGNPIGEAGARILMSLPSTCGSRVTFSARNCDLTMKQSACWFDTTDPICDEIILDMSKGYDLAVMYEILDLVARHSSYQFGHVQYGDDIHTKNWKELHFTLLEEKVTKFTQSESESLAKLKKTVEIAENIELCKNYFQASDNDNSGELSEEEFFDIVDKIGLSLSHRQKISAMSLYDTDHSGAIQLEEFVEFINEVAKDSRARIRDIETTARCAETSTPNHRYYPPRRGIFKLKIVNGYVIGETSRALTEEQVRNMIAMAKNSSSPTTLMQYAAESDLLRLAEAQDIFNHIVTECGDPAVALSAVLPHMTTTTEAKNLITLCCNDDDNIKQKLKLQFGNAFRPMIGLADGFYSLDFSLPTDRLCMTKLLELSTTGASERINHHLGDVSQDGNWSSFRNEYFSGHEIRLTQSFLSPMPTSGKIEFDFISSDRPPSSVICITDRKLIQNLLQINLLSSTHIHWAYDELTELRSVCRKSLSTIGSTPYWNCTIGRIIEAQKYKHEKFYSNLSTRNEQLERAIKREQKYSSVSSHNNQTLLKRHLSRSGTSMGLLSLGLVSDDENNNNDDDDNDSDNLFSNNNTLNENNINNQLFKSNSKPNVESIDTATPTNNNNNNNNNNVPTSNSNSRSPSITPVLSPKNSLSNKRLSKSILFGQNTNSNITTTTNNNTINNINTVQLYENGIQSSSICAKMVDKIEQLFVNKWIYVRHLILIIKSFRMGTLKKTDFGTYRVEIIVSLFCRLKDTHNFSLIFASLTTEEHGMILARIGILNIFDPFRPEGAYSLDLSIWEERQVCKILIHIAAVEPGSNWKTQIYQFDRLMKPSTGWLLNVNWYTEDGLPTKGIVSLEYTSGYGIKFNNCHPKLEYRQILISLVLHRVDDYAYDDEVIIVDRLNSPLLHKLKSNCTIEKSNELLTTNGIDIKWNYNSLLLTHE